MTPGPCGTAASLSASWPICQRLLFRPLTVRAPPRPFRRTLPPPRVLLVHAEMEPVVGEVVRLEDREIGFGQSDFVARVVLDDVSDVDQSGYPESLHRRVREFEVLQLTVQIFPETEPRLASTTGISLLAPKQGTFETGTHEIL